MIGTVKALDSIFKEIAGDLRDESPPRRLQDLKLKAGSDNGSEFTGADIDALMAKYNVTHEYGIKGRPMSQSLVESHVGEWKRRFASWVRARMDAIGEEDEDSKSALEIKSHPGQIWSGRSSPLAPSSRWSVCYPIVGQLESAMLRKPGAYVT